MSSPIDAHHRARDGRGVENGDDRNRSNACKRTKIENAPGKENGGSDPSRDGSQTRMTTTKVSKDSSRMTKSVIASVDAMGVGVNQSKMSIGDASVGGVWIMTLLLRLRRLQLTM